STELLLKLDNLFNGDKILSDNVLQIMNENWAEVFADVKSSYEDAFAQVASGIFGNLLAKVPAAEIFGGD
ncbi:JHBP domain containing protein, partial [Asbolus verrucosus]